MVITKSRFIKNVKKIGTHNGKFHSDEVFAIAILKLINPNFEVIRTRDAEELNNCDMRLDVGGMFNEKTFDFDHHQETFTDKRENNIPYASCGLIWRSFGHILLKDPEQLQAVDDRLIQHIDADDCGIKIYETKKANVYTLQHVINSYLPAFNDKVQDFDLGFYSAIDFATHIIKYEIKKAKSQTKIKKDLEKVVKKFVDKKYAVLEKSLPWKNYLVDNSKFLFILYKGSTGNWHIQGVPKSKDSFEVRQEFPKSWAGLRDSDLVEKTNIKSSIFCHKNLFLTVVKSKKDAIELVENIIDNKYKK